MKIDISVIVVSYNTCNILERCLHAAIDALHGFAYELVVVDNASNDGSQAMVKEKFPGCHLITNLMNQGFARACNQGIQCSQGSIILLLNSDAFLNPDAIQKMIPAIQSLPMAGILGPALVYPDGRVQRDHGPLPTLFTEVCSLLGLDKPSLRIPLNKQVKQTGVVSGACMLVKRVLLDQIGLFDESYFFFSEEIDLCRRANQGGWVVYYLPAAEVIHMEGASSGRSAYRIRLLYQGKLNYFAKYFPGWQQQMLWFAIWITSLLKFIFYWAARKVTKGGIRRDEVWRKVLSCFPFRAGIPFGSNL